MSIVWVELLFAKLGHAQARPPPCRPNTQSHSTYRSLYLLSKAPTANHNQDLRRSIEIDVKSRLRGRVHSFFRPAAD